jgi:hypothetical protein
MKPENRKAKFLARILIDAGTGCWNFQGMKCPTGYGQVKRDGKFLFAHRYSWILHRGEIGPYFVLHKCDNRACVNPDHLFLGTQKDNQQDMRSKGRHIHGEKSKTSKLKTEQVLEIYRLYESGVGTIRLSRMFGVTKNLCWLIVRGKAWNHLYGLRGRTNDSA